jgi:hypothetical protein
MRVHHLSDRVALEGEIDDVFRKWDTSKPDNLPMVPVLEQLRKHVAGPDLWAYEGHSQLTLVPHDASNDVLLRVINMDRFTNCYKVVYEPMFDGWPTTVAIRTPNAVQTAMAIARVLTLIAKDYGEFTYVNSNPPLPVRRKGTWIRCPHCDVLFEVTDPQAWNDEERHLFCGQRLVVE